MVRELVIATLTAGAAIGVTPTATADPHWKTDVPGIVYNARMNDACMNWDRYIFGRTAGGEALACHFIPNQWPPKDTGFWTISYPLVGEATVGSECPGPQYVAQSPDGYPMVCVGQQGWVQGIFTSGAGPYAPPGIVPYPLEHEQPYYPPLGS